VLNGCVGDCGGCVYASVCCRFFVVGVVSVSTVEPCRSVSVVVAEELSRVEEI